MAQSHGLKFTVSFSRHLQVFCPAVLLKLLFTACVGMDLARQPWKILIAHVLYIYPALQSLFAQFTWEENGGRARDKLESRLKFWGITKYYGMQTLNYYLKTYSAWRGVQSKLLFKLKSYIKRGSWRHWGITNRTMWPLVDFVLRKAWATDFRYLQLST